MNSLDHLLEITANDLPGYHPLTHFEGWRVAIYNEKPDDVPGGISFLERHMNTDEVFLLLQGSCRLWIAGGANRPTDLRAVVMEPRQCYNVKKGTWHNLTLSDGGAVFIVENHDTARENSEYYDFQPGEGLR